MPPSPRSPCRAAVVAIAALAASLTSCGSPGQPAARTDLTGASYIVVKANENPYLRVGKARLTFSGREVTGTGGCNPIGFFAFDVVGGRLTVTARSVADNLMSCVDDVRNRLAQQDDWLSAVLRSRPRIYVGDAGRTLVLKTSEQRVTFKREWRRRPAVQRRLDELARRMERDADLVRTQLDSVDDEQGTGGTADARQAALIKRFNRRMRPLEVEWDALERAPKLR